jgi:hypothetical protein
MFGDSGFFERCLLGAISVLLHTPHSMNLTLPVRSFAKAIPLALLLAMPAPLYAVTAMKIDLTSDQNRAKVDRTYTYNLGPTGMRGWIDHGWSETAFQDGYTAFAPFPKTPKPHINEKKIFNKMNSEF